MTDFPFSLPLPPYSRPAFACRTALKRLESIQRNEVSVPLDFMEILGWVFELRLARYYVADRSASGWAIPEDFFDILKNLNVFVPPSFVKKWEHDKVWNTYGVPAEMTKYFHELSETTPSDMYIHYNSYQIKIWNRWLEKASSEDVLELLTYSENTWVNWAQTLNRVDGPYYRATQGLSPLFQLDADQAHYWGMWEEWVGRAPRWFPQLVELMGTSAEKWMPAFAQTLNCPIELINSLWGLNGALVRAGLYKNLDTAEQHVMLPIRQNKNLLEWQTPLWSSLRTKNPHSRTLNWEHLFQPWVFKHLPDSPSLFLGNPEWAPILSSSLPEIVLVAGGAGSGKTTCISQLLQERKKSGYTLKKTTKEGLAIVEWMMKNTPAVLVVEDEDFIKSKDFKEFLKTTTLSVILRWSGTVASLGETIARRCKSIMDLDNVFYTQRLAVANYYFKKPHSDLALRVARSLRRPVDIARAAFVCHQSNTYSWDVVQHMIGSFQAVGGEEVDYIKVMTPTELKEIPALGASEKWDKLFKVLGSSFEDPQRCKSLGGSPPKGAVLLGPPGTGKTLFARHLARRFEVTCLSVDCVKAAENVKQMFEIARNYAPCVVILDEANVFLDKEKYEKSCLAFTSQLDGVENLEGVMFIATTNMYSVQIHSPIKRSGRLSEVHDIGVPSTPERAEIWRVYLKDKPLDQELESAIELVNRVSRSFTGADIKEVMRKTVEEALPTEDKTLKVKNILRMCDQLSWSNPDGNDTVSPQERWSVAIHEAGHALLAWRGGFDVMRITIRSRDSALGSVHFQHPEGLYRQSKTHLVQLVQMYFGGIAAEQSVFGHYDRGGTGDLAQVRKTLQSAFTHQGLGAAGPLAAPSGYGQDGVWTEMMREEVELECRYWAKELFDECSQWLTAHQDILKDLAQELMDNLDLSLDDVLPFEQRVKALKDIPVSIPHWRGGARHPARRPMEDTDHNRSDQAISLHFEASNKHDS